MLWAEDDPLRENVCQPRDPPQEALGLPHNGPEAVTAEINDKAIRKLLTKTAGVTSSLEAVLKTEEVRLTVTADDWSDSPLAKPMHSLSHYVLRYPTLQARDRLPTRLRAEIKRYLTIRLTGHTRDFAVASFSRTLPAASSATPSSTNVVLDTYKEVPESWLKVWEVDGKAAGYYVIDGPLAWTWRGWGNCLELGPSLSDTQVGDPKLKEVFAEARKKATANLKARRVRPGLGYCHADWAELKKVLWEDYQIRWWCPTDLNGGYFD